MGKIHVIIVCNMTHHFPTIACVCLISFAGAAMAQDAQQLKLKNDLETVYNTWRQSMIRHSFEEWQKTTSAYRQMKVRNLAVSEKRPFPASLFQSQMSPASLMSLKYVGAVVKGPTATATYFGKIDWNIGGNPTENALVIHFTHERGAWKFDQAHFFNLANLPAVKERLRAGDASILHEQDGFQPSGAIPPIDKACPLPRYIAKVFVDCPGRRVDATVNDISSHTFENISRADVVSGGVRDGLNTISIRVRPVEGSKDKGPMFVGVYIMPETEGNIPGKPFTFTLAEDKQDGLDQSFTFNVTPDVIRLMNPGEQEKQP